MHTYAATSSLIVALVSLNSAFADPCCSWNFNTCADPGSWCNLSEQNCGNCNGHWVDPGAMASGCTARWSYCESSAECCNDPASPSQLTCQKLDGETGFYAGCQIDEGGPTIEDLTPHPTHCCSWNLKDCGDTDGNWCHLDEYNCEMHCFGFWIDTTILAETPTCKPRWSGGCVMDSQCCYDGNFEHEMECQDLPTSDGGTYSGCQVKDLFPQGSNEGCFEVEPDFSCSDPLEWQFCFIKSYNMAFENIAYINEVTLLGSCTDESRRRDLKKKKKKKATGGCSGCEDEELPDESLFRRLMLRDGAAGESRKLASSAGEMFREKFHECLGIYFSSEMADAGYTVDDMSLQSFPLSDCAA